MIRKYISLSIKLGGGSEYYFYLFGLSEKSLDLKDENLRCREISRWNSKRKQTFELEGSFCTEDRREEQGAGSRGHSYLGDAR